MSESSRRRILLAITAAASTGCLRFQSEGAQTSHSGAENGQGTDGSPASPAAGTDGATATTATAGGSPSSGDAGTGTAGTATGTAEVAFRTGGVDRNADGDAASGGVIATIQAYGGADSVQIIYRIPDQNAVLYRSERFPVADVKQSGALGPRQRDPSRQAHQLMASDIDSEGKEYGLYDGEHAIVLFYERGALADSVIYEVGTGTLQTTVTTPPTDQDDSTPPETTSEG